MLTPISASVISILPIPYSAQLPGMNPSFIFIPAVKSKENPGDLTVVPIPDATEHVYVRDGMTLKRSISGVEIAAAIANDYRLGSLFVEESSTGGLPGIKALPGNHTVESVKQHFADELKELEASQKLWFAELVKRADDTWSDPNQRRKHRAISDLQRIACRELNLDKEWLVTVNVTTVKCWSCTTHVPEEALVCSNCKVILKPQEYAVQLKLRGISASPGNLPENKSTS